MSKIKTPGMLIKPLCLDALNVSITDAAKLLNMTRENLSKLVHGQISVSPEMALKLEAVFNINGRKLFLLQCEFDFEQARKKKLNLKRISKRKIKVEWPKK